MKIITDKDKCTGCKVCVRVCPQKILEVIDKKMRVIDESRCMGCFGCEDECNEGAVRLLRAPQDVTDVVVEPPPENVAACDVAIVGAGPSGLGAAITCARAGLDVVVFDRLPNRKLCHHTDGGVLFSFPGQTTIVVDGTTVSFPDLDISIEAAFLRECDHLGLLGPDGLRTQSEFPKGLSGWAGNKDGFVEALVNETQSSGARLWYNAKVTDVLHEGDVVTGVQLASGEEIRSKVVVCADGCFAKISEKAGMAINIEDLWYAQVLAFEYDNTENIPTGLFYLNGDLPFGNETPAAFGGVGITAVIHVLVAFFDRNKYYKAPHPMDHYVTELIAKDPRVRELLGTSFDNVKPDLLTGCRGIFRGACNTEPVGNGVISVGDAWVDDGEIGNVPALSNGVYAGKVIINAFRKGDFSKQTLMPVKNFITKRFLTALEKNKQMKLLGTRFDKQEMTTMFRFLQHMNYPVMLLGSPAQQGVMFARFFLRNFFRFFRYPKITRAMF